MQIKSHAFKKELDLTHYATIPNDTTTDELMDVFMRAKKVGIELTEGDKKFLFAYAQLGFDKIDDVTGESLERYTSNMVLVVNCFLEYGFEPKELNLEHYWDIITELFSA